MENKKTIIKKALGKYQGKGGPVARTPFKMLGDYVKNAPGNISSNLKYYLKDKPQLERKNLKIDEDIAKLRKARDFGGAPNFEDGRYTKAYVARFNAEEVKKRRMGNAKEKNY